MRKIVVPDKSERQPPRAREGAGEGGRPKLGLKYGGGSSPQSGGDA